MESRIWDVGKGSSNYIKAATKDVVIDCGRNGSEGFSPMQHISSPARNYGVSKIDYLIITHPHNDHIDDLPNLDEHGLHPKRIHRARGSRELVEEKLTEERNSNEPDEAYIENAEIYLELDNYDEEPEPPQTSNPAWSTQGGEGVFTDGGEIGVSFHKFSATGDDIGSGRYDRLNNMSILTVVQAQDSSVTSGDAEPFKLVTCGDLMPEGIDDIMETTSAMETAEDADVLVAPHHGRESSFNREFVEQVNPDLVVFSDKSVDDGVTANGKYNDVANGAEVSYEYNGESEERKVITTRNDGRVKLLANNSDDCEVSVWGTNYADMVSGEAGTDALDGDIEAKMSRLKRRYKESAR